LGHSHRRAVLLLYFWTAVLALGGVALSVYRAAWVVLALVAAGLVGLVISVVPRWRSGSRSLASTRLSP
jgi:UDP-GlcNAc:undecaprenyl-phosphate GlcNAc-1-phosphate transferase